MNTQEFLDSGEYLPEFMRDFHDQKLLFKFLGEMVHNAKDKADSIGEMQLSRLPDWIAAQIYTIDFFLWTMARHGYTLQKSRRHIDDFSDIEERVFVRYRQYLLDQFSSVINSEEPAPQKIPDPSPCTVCGALNWTGVEICETCGFSSEVSK